MEIWREKLFRELQKPEQNLNFYNNPREHLGKVYKKPDILLNALYILLLSSYIVNTIILLILQVRKAYINYHLVLETMNEIQG